jgi:hypothetical protein
MTAWAIVTCTVFDYRYSVLRCLTGPYGSHCVHIFLYCDVLLTLTARLQGPTKRMKTPWYLGHSVNRHGSWLCRRVVCVMYLRILQDT